VRKRRDKYLIDDFIVIKIKIHGLIIQFFFKLFKEERDAVLQHPVEKFTLDKFMA